MDVICFTKEYLFVKEISRRVKVLCDSNIPRIQTVVKLYKINVKSGMQSEKTCKGT